MSIALPARPRSALAADGARPSFLGLLRGELFKISRQRSTWVMAVLLAVIIAVPDLVIAAAGGTGIKTIIQTTPLTALYAFMGADLLVLRIFSGTFLIITTARLIGMEYSGGTIRVLLARGVGRLQLLGAKLGAMAVLSLAILAGGALLGTLLSVFALNAVGGNLDALKALNSGFWQDTLVYIGTIALNMGVSIMMAAAVTVLTRSLAAGLTLGVSFFAADNIGVIFFLLAARLTGSSFWSLATGDLLGPNLNVMPGAVLPARASSAAAAGVMAPPLVPVTGGHTLLIAAIWTAAFIAVAVGLTWKRDVTE
ncbi:MAG: ABC transporter permease [Ktedonobacterales bacterium]